VDRPLDVDTVIDCVRDRPEARDHLDSSGGLEAGLTHDRGQALRRWGAVGEAAPGRAPAPRVTP
jgi:hypothetical protein